MAFSGLVAFDIWPRIRRVIAGFILFVLGLLAVVPINQLMLKTLEQRFPQVSGVPENSHGIIVLSGYAGTRLTEVYGTPEIGGSVERLTTFMTLGSALPQHRMIHAGGNGLLVPGALSEGDVAAQILEDLNFPLDRVEFEDQSRNTYESAVYTADLLSPDDLTKSWVLITSASHMPRAVGSFEQAGFTNLVPYSVDWRTVPGSNFLSLTTNPLQRLTGLSHPLHEWVGLTAYYAMGRTSELFPGPK